MTTLHDLLKRDGKSDRQQTPREDLRRRYSPIGISAVAAACRYSHDDDQSTVAAHETTTRRRSQR